MADSKGDYELVDRGIDVHDGDGPAGPAAIQPHTPDESDKQPLVHDDESTEYKGPSPPSPQTPVLLKATQIATPISKHGEEPKVALERSVRQLLLSFAIHIIPSATTITLVSLSIFNVYFFDSDGTSTSLPIDMNELFNLFQFVAKIHEILLVSSLSAMVMHLVRIFLLGQRGLPFGLLTAGYSVGSAEYLLSKPFLTSAATKTTWIFVALIAVFTALANTLGPASAIALIPSLDWWQMKHPFGTESLPVLLQGTSSDIWPLTVGMDQATITNDTTTDGRVACYKSSSYNMVSGCPASGWETMKAWAVSNSNQGIAANVTFIDDVSGAQRIVKSRLTDRNGSTPGVAITTSISESMATVVGSFWEQTRNRGYPVDAAMRPRLRVPSSESIYQPLVQVQCTPHTLSFLHTLNMSRNSSVESVVGINTFSAEGPTAWKLPDWIYDFQYKPSNRISADGLRLSKSTAYNVSWVDGSGQDGFNLSTAAIVVTPILLSVEPNDTNSIYQEAIVHTCSVDARWIATDVIYDATADITVQHNISDPLLFQRRPNPTGQSGMQDRNRWGVSPAIQLTMDWLNALNLPLQVDNATTDAITWLFTPYTNSFLDDRDGGNMTTDTVGVSENNANKSVIYDFNPGVNMNNNVSSIRDATGFVTASSETVATLLGLYITDGLARIAVDPIQQTSVLVTQRINETAYQVEALANFAGSDGLIRTENATVDEINQAPSRLTFSVERYGYGYGFRTATVGFGAAILLSHTFIAVVYIAYALYDFFAPSGHGWTSGVWGGMAEFAALLINSRPSEELQNTCAGVDKRETWRLNVRIRECGEGHLGVVVGNGAATSLPTARRGWKYGKLGREETAMERHGLMRRRMRRGSI
jgi:hypothetical protein